MLFPPCKLLIVFIILLTAYAYPSNTYDRIDGAGKYRQAGSEALFKQAARRALSEAKARQIYTHSRTIMLNFTPAHCE